MGKQSKQTFLKIRHTNGQQVYEKMLNITIREMQNKTTMRYHLTPIKMACIKKTGNRRCWWLGMVAQACNPIILGAKVGISLGQEFKTSLTNTVKPCFY